MRRWLWIGVLSVCAVAGAARAQEGQAPAGPPPGPPQVRIPEARIEEALRRLDLREPPVGVVVGAALEAWAVDPDGAAAVASRARLGGLVPTVRARARRGQGRDLSELQTDDSGRATWSSDDDLVLEGSLTFQLDRLVFAREEVPLLREERARHAERRALVRTVVAVYFERRRLLLERALLGGAGPAEAVRIEELGALLDAFTGGAFSRMMVRPR